MSCHSIATKPVASLLAGAMLSFSALPTIGCTSIVFRAQDGTGIYARTMEWGASDLKSELVLVPRRLAFTSALGAGTTGMAWNNPYGFVGVNAAGLPYATDGMNEAGLTVGALFFPGFAEYQQPSGDQQSTTISSVDIVNYLLGNFATVEEVRQAMPKVRVVRNTEIEKAFGGPIPLHHVVTDASGASIVKQLASTMVDFDPRFEIMPGTKARETEVTGYVESGIQGKADPFEAVPRQTITE